MKTNYFIYVLQMGLFLSLFSCNEPFVSKNKAYQENQRQGNQQGAGREKKPKEDLSQQINALIEDIKKAPSLSKLDDLISNANSLMDNQNIITTLREKKLELLKKKISPLKTRFQELENEKNQLEDRLKHAL